MCALASTGTPVYPRFTPLHWANWSWPFLRCDKKLEEDSTIEKGNLWTLEEKKTRGLPRKTRGRQRKARGFHRYREPLGLGRGNLSLWNCSERNFLFLWHFPSSSIHTHTTYTDTWINLQLSEIPLRPPLTSTHCTSNNRKQMPPLVRASLQLCSLLITFDSSNSSGWTQQSLFTFLFAYHQWHQMFDSSFYSSDVTHFTRNGAIIGEYLCV